MLQRDRSSMNIPNFLETLYRMHFVRSGRMKAFKKKSRQAKLNRSSDCSGFGGSLHLGGSITVSQHRANLVKFSNYWHYLEAIYIYIYIYMCVCYFSNYFYIILNLHCCCYIYRQDCTIELLLYQSYFAIHTNIRIKHGWIGDQRM